MLAASSSAKHCLFAGELVVERPLAGAGVPDDVGHRRLAVAALLDRGGQPVEQPAPETVRGGGRGTGSATDVLTAPPSHNRPLSALVPKSTVPSQTVGTGSTRNRWEDPSPMSEAPTVDLPVNAEPKLPPTPPVPGALVLAACLVSPAVDHRLAHRRYGRCYDAASRCSATRSSSPDPALTKQVFTTSPGRAPQHPAEPGRLLGPGSVFALDGAAHRGRRSCSPARSTARASRPTGGSSEETLAGDRSVAGGAGSSDARADDAHHPQHHPARGVRRRRCELQRLRTDRSG